jgi:hypothetical protein
MRSLSVILVLCCLATLSNALAVGHCAVDETGCENTLSPYDVFHCTRTVVPVSSGFCMCCVDYNQDGQYHWVTCPWTDWVVTLWCSYGSVPEITTLNCKTRNPAACVVGTPPAPCVATPIGP